MLRQPDAMGAMAIVVGIVLVVGGAAQLLVGPHLARHRISLHFSTEDLRATSGARYRRVRRTRIAAYVFNEAIGVFWIYMGSRILAG